MYDEAVVRDPFLTVFLELFCHGQLMNRLTQQTVTTDRSTPTTKKRVSFVERSADYGDSYVETCPAVDCDDVVSSCCASRSVFDSDLRSNFTTTADSREKSGTTGSTSENMRSSDSRSHVSHKFLNEDVAAPAAVNKAAKQQQSLPVKYQRKDVDRRKHQSRVSPAVHGIKSKAVHAHRTDTGASCKETTEDPSKSVSMQNYYQLCFSESLTSVPQIPGPHVHERGGLASRKMAERKSASCVSSNESANCVQQMDFPGMQAMRIEAASGFTQVYAHDESISRCKPGSENQKTLQFAHAGAKCSQRVHSKDPRRRQLCASEVCGIRVEQETRSDHRRGGEIRSGKRMSLRSPAAKRTFHVTEKRGGGMGSMGKGTSSHGPNTYVSDFDDWKLPIAPSIQKDFTGSNMDINLVQKMKQVVPENRSKREHYEYAFNAELLAHEIEETKEKMKDRFRAVQGAVGSGTGCAGRVGSPPSARTAALLHRLRRDCWLLNWLWVGLVTATAGLGVFLVLLFFLDVHAIVLVPA
ncbi:unnamed protein product [Notodromas monacha]|uniref:Transmembrane protein n=1 Tax=Notodromas monacha TaxID=399045 RepID=A0A7R9BLS8_9CRUS|nr:unnamed protein product [Notodromas monacha]CAG0916766.1 unnamed protein product [Notodromas monacha]